MRTAPITAESSAKVIPITAATKPNAKGAFDKFKQAWLERIALDHELPEGALRLCIVVSGYMSRSLGGEAFPGMALLAAKTGLSRRWIVELTKLIEQRGHWKVTRHRSGRKNLANRYHPTLCTTVHHPSEVATSLPSELATSPPSEVATSPEPLNELLSESLNEPLSLRGGFAAHGINTEVTTTQTKRVAEEGREATLTTPDNPSLPSKREPPKAEIVRGFEALRGTLGLCRDPLDRDGAAATISPDTADLVTR
jgi:hypothetical protein